MQVTVNGAAPVNQPPVANAGNNVIITMPVNTAALNGSGTDPDGSISSYHWAKISGPAGSAIANIAAAQTTATGLIQGVYKFELTVTDNIGATGKDTMQVTVNTAVIPANNNIPPVADAGQDISIVLPANAATLKGSGTDVDGRVVGYSWRIISGGGQPSLLNPSFAQSLLTSLQQGIYDIELTVTDNGGATGKDTVQVAVGSSRSAPPTAENDLKLMPNPVKTVMDVQITSGTAVKSVSLKLLDVLGILRYQKEVLINQAVQIEKIDMTNFEAGTYILQLIYDDLSRINRKVIKQ